MLELRTLGTLDLRADGAPVSSVLAQPRRTAFFCYLALARPTGYHPRDALFALFWPEHESESARHALRQSLYFLRRSLGSDMILSRGDDALAINVDRLRCDVWEFEQALRARKQREALELYQGDLLPGFFVSDAPAFERWLEDERSRARRSATEAAWLLAGSAETAGDVAEARNWATRAVQLSPLDETGLRRLLELLERLGDRGGALAAYEAFVQTLDREYGSGPSDATKELAAGIRGERRAGESEAPQNGREPDRLREPSDALSVRVSPARQSPADAEIASVTASRLPDVGRLAHAQDEQGSSGRARRPRPASARLGAVALGIAGLFVLGVLLVPPILRRADQSTGLQSTSTSLTSFGSATAATDTASAGSLLAYELTTRAGDPTLQRTDAGSRQMLELYARAIEADSIYAPAHAGLAHAYLRVNFGQDPDMPYRDALLLAEQAALRSLALDSLLPFAYDALGKVYLHSYRFDEANRLLHRALELDPTLMISREHLIQLNVFIGRPDVALREAELANQADPLSSYMIAELARAHVANGDCDAAMAQLSLIAALEPPVARAFPLRAQCLAARGDLAGAVATMRGDQHRVPYAEAVLAFFLARSGQTEDALAILRALQERYLSGNGTAFPVAVVYAGLEDFESALGWLDRAIDDRSVREWIREPMYADLRRQPGFDRIAQRIGLVDYR
jgi:DNA-binding SARP family transcriptional activator